MIKNRFDIRLKHEGRGEYFTIDGVEQKRDPEDLISLLKNGTKTGTIKSGMVKSDKLFTRYIFNIQDYDEKEDEEIKSRISIRVLNKEKDLLKSLPLIESYCNNSVKMKKINQTRLVAGILAAVVLATTAGPTIVKGLGKLLEKEEEYDNYRYSQFQDMVDSIEPNITDSEKIAMDREYYEDLEESAKSGDKAALEEYKQYLIEQQLKAQAEEYQEEYNKTM